MSIPKQIWTIYCHTHIKSGRRYVGLTSKTVEKRWLGHLISSRRYNGRRCAHFWNAIRKYGKDAFSHQILEICDSLSYANWREEAWIDLF